MIAWWAMQRCFSGPIKSKLAGVSWPRFRRHGKQRRRPIFQTTKREAGVQKKPTNYWGVGECSGRKLVTSGKRNKLLNAGITPRAFNLETTQVLDDKK